MMSDNGNAQAEGTMGGLVGFGIVNRLRARRLKRRASETARLNAPAAHSRIPIVRSLLKGIVYSALLTVYLLVEVLVAMTAYMYLNLHHIQTFGYLIGISRTLLNAFANHLEKLSPEIANQAYATILGELGAKSILLLFIGLAVSAAIRALIWFVHKSVEVVRPGKLEEAKS